MHSSLAILKNFILNPNPNKLPSEIDIRSAECLLGCDKAVLIADMTDLYMQSVDTTSPLYGWARTDHIDSGRISAWNRKYR